MHHSSPLQNCYDHPSCQYKPTAGTKYYSFFFSIKPKTMPVIPLLREKVPFELGKKPNNLKLKPVKNLVTQLALPSVSKKDIQG